MLIFYLNGSLCHIQGCCHTLLNCSMHNQNSVQDGFCKITLQLNLVSRIIHEFSIASIKDKNWDVQNLHFLKILNVKCVIVIIE